MATIKFPPCPPQLKSVQHYLKLASDYETREPIISYWARLYALQSALKIDRRSSEAKALLTSLMDWLETFKKGSEEYLSKMVSKLVWRFEIYSKKCLHYNLRILNKWNRLPTEVLEHPQNEAISNDVAGQAVLENEAHKLFTKADGDDRAANFSKNVVKTFYTAGVLFDVIEVFGELTEELVAQRKYAKWKATYIHNCLKNGETPLPGPNGADDIAIDKEEPRNINYHQPDASENNPGFHLPPVPGASEQPPSSFPPAVKENPQVVPTSGQVVPPSSSGITLPPQSFSQAQKYCKFAISSLDFEDTPSAISYLTKALNLLTNGKES